MSGCCDTHDFLESHARSERIRRYRESWSPPDRTLRVALAFIISRAIDCDSVLM